MTLTVFEKLLKSGNAYSASPVNAETIAEAEQRLGIVFADDYCLYLSKYGQFSAGDMELTGLTSLSYNDVVELTGLEREYNPDFPQGLYVVENLGIDGLLALQGEDGDIYGYSPSQELTLLFKSLEDYVAYRQE